MRAAIEKRVAVLQEEAEKAREYLAKVEQERDRIIQVSLRIAGAITVLQELMQEPPSVPPPPEPSLWMDVDEAPAEEPF